MYGTHSTASRCAALGILVLIGPIVLAHAGTRTVCKEGCEYTRINSAIHAASDGDIISVGPGTYFENVVVSNKTLTINGYSQDYTAIDGGYQGAAVSITGSAAKSVTLNKLTLTHGSASGLAVTAASVSLFKVAIISNLSADNGAGAGGGILALHSQMTITHSIVAHNHATTGVGGGISADRNEWGPSHITLVDSDIFDNLALRGGGVYIGPLSTLTMGSSTLVSNSAQLGAGAYIGAFRHDAVEETGFLTFNSSTMANNRATDSGGGIYVAIEVQGGAFTDSFIVGNSAGRSGGGIALPEFGTVTLTRTTLTGNHPENCSSNFGNSCP